jgi:hypothetical protein
MKPKTVKRNAGLKLNRDTLRRLADQQLNQVAGAGPSAANEHTMPRSCLGNTCVPQ